MSQLCAVVHTMAPAGALKGKLPGSCRTLALGHWRKLVEVTCLFYDSASTTPKLNVHDKLIPPFMQLCMQVMRSTDALH